MLTQQMYVEKLLLNLLEKCRAEKMKLGRVIGNVVSTRKDGNLDGLKIMIVAYLDENLAYTHKTAACIDTVNAGNGDLVLLCSTSSARMTRMTKHSAADNTIIAIIDSITSEKTNLYKKSDGDLK